MFLEIVIALIAGVLGGTITGLIPGIHVNLVAAMLLSISPLLLNYTSGIVLAVFIISMAVTHTFLDAVPSIFLGAPDSDTVMAVLPGHKLLLEGLGYDAVRLTVIGSLLCLIAGIILTPLFVVIFPLIYNLVKDYIGYLLLCIIIFIILKEDGVKEKAYAALVFAVSGILGLIVFSSSINQPLFAMLSGLFGVSTLLVSMFENASFPAQIISEFVKLKKSDYAVSVFAAILSGSIITIFPGLGSAQAASLSSVFFRIKQYSYLVLVGGISTLSFLVSLVTVYTLEKARNGAIITVVEIIKSINLPELALFSIAALVAGGISAIITLQTAKVFSSVIERMNYKIMALAVVLFILAMTVYFSGLIGVLVLVIGTAIGIIPPLAQCQRSHAMGCILLPVIVMYLM